MGEEVSDREVLLETFRQTRTIKRVLAGLLGVVLVVLAINVLSAYRASQEQKKVCASVQETLENTEGNSPSLDALRADLERRQRALC